jgi:archaellum component FlaC
MQSFSTDLALKIEAGFETILTNQIQNGIIPELQSLKIEIENLSKKLQNPAVEMTQNVVKDLESALNKMIEELKTSISGSTKSEFETLTTLIQQAGASFMEIPSRLQNMIGNLEEKFNGLQEIVQQTTKQTLTQSNESIEQMKKQVEDISDIFKTKFGDLQSGQENLVSKQSENLQISDRLLIAFNDSIEKMSGLTQNITTTISGFDSAQNNLNLATGQLMLIAENVNKSSNTFKDVQTNFLQQIKHFFEATFKTIQEIQKSLLNAKDVSTDYSQKFTIIQNGLQSIFGEIQRGLNDYRDTIGTSMEKYLGELQRR